MSTAEAAHGHNPDDPIAAHHELTQTNTGIENKKLIMWLFLASDCMFFGTLISTHLIYRKLYPAGHFEEGVVDVTGTFDIELTSFSTFILLMSSFLMALAVSAMHKGQVKSFRNNVIGVILFGLIFLGGQVYEFQHFFHGQGWYEWKAIPRAEGTAAHHGEAATHGEEAVETAAHTEGAGAEETAAAMTEEAASHEGETAETAHETTEAAMDNAAAEGAEAVTESEQAAEATAEVAGPPAESELLVGTLGNGKYFHDVADTAEAKHAFEEKHPNWEVTEFKQAKVVPGLSLQNSLFGSTFYVLTGTHGTHVAIGILWLFSMLIYSYSGRLRAENAVDVEIAGLYWHFVDIVWIIIFTAVYLVEYVV